MELVAAALVLEDQGRVVSGDLGRDMRAVRPERGDQDARVGPLGHRQDLEEAPGRGLGPVQDRVEDGRVGAARVRHVRRQPDDAAAQHARELAKEDRLPVRQDLEPLLVEPEEPRRRQRHDRGRARIARDERHFAEAVAGAEDGDPLAPAVAFAAHLDGPAHDDVERVSRIALREHRLAGSDVELVELADEASEHLAREIGEERDRPERSDDRVHDRPVAGTLDAPESVRQGGSGSRGTRHAPGGRVFSRTWNRSTS